jgi:peptide/nickel transport system permease protein
MPDGTGESALPAGGQREIAPELDRRGESQAQVVWQQFKKHHMALAGGVVLILLILMALFAPFLAPQLPNAYSTTNITSYAPPTPIHFIDPQTGRLSWPFVYNYTQTLDMTTFENVYKPDTSQKYYLHFFVHAAPYKLFSLIPTDIHLFGVAAPAHVFLFGADNLGRDLFSRTLYGAQVSLSIGLLATFITFILAIVLGSLAGFFGGWLDNIVMRLVEVIYAVPALFLLIALRAAFPINMNPLLILYIIIGILGFISWGGLARVVRGQLMATKELDYVQAAKSLGARSNRLIILHLLPSVVSYVIVDFTLSIPTFIIAESGLSFLGLGVTEPYVSWGSLLNLAQQGGFSSINEQPWMIIPGFFIVLTVLCFQLLGDGLRDAFDPHKRR